MWHCYTLIGFCIIWEIVVSENVTSTIAPTVTNETSMGQIMTNDKVKNLSIQFDSTPFLPYSGKLQFPVSFSQYTNKELNNPRTTAIQLPADPFPPIIYDSNFGNHVSEYESHDSSLKPSARHFVVVGFIGLLLLFAVIQNTIEATKRKAALVDALSSRKKRELLVSQGLNGMTPEQKDIISNDARLRCIQRIICLQNRKLLEDFGSSGEILAKYLVRGMKKVLNDSSGWDRLVEDAGIAGTLGNDCDILYRDCN